MGYATCPCFNPSDLRQVDKETALALGHKLVAEYGERRKGN
jgi:hypothetical protein